MKVRDVMNSRVVSVRDKDFATTARGLFRDYGYRSFPVVDEQNRLVGVITRGDILNITSSRSNIPVAGIMSPPVFFTYPDEDLMKVAEVMVKNNIGRMPVVKSSTDMTLIGVVSAHDILSKLVERIPKKKVVEEVMTREVVTCSPEDAITKVLDKMLETGYSGIPVVKNGRVIGMVTRMDIIRSGHARISREDDKGKVKHPPQVAKIMKTPVETVYPSTPVVEAAKKMIERNIGRLPVVEDGKLVGIVDREDLIRAWL